MHKDLCYNVPRVALTIENMIDFNLKLSLLINTDNQAAIFLIGKILQHSTAGLCLKRTHKPKVSLI